MYHIEVAEKYGSDNTFKTEQTITSGKSFSRAEAYRRKKLMQKYSNSLIYRVKKDK